MVLPVAAPPDLPPATLPPDVRALVDRTLEEVAEGHDVILMLEGALAQTVLDAAAGRLAGSRSRVVRIAGAIPGGLGLPNFLAQLRSQAIPMGRAASATERDFATLTMADAGHDQVVLMVSNAEELRFPTLRYLQLACQRGKGLRLVLAGNPYMLALLDDPEMARLQSRLQHAARRMAFAGAALPARLPGAALARAPRLPSAGLVPRPSRSTAGLVAGTPMAPPPATPGRWPWWSPALLAGGAAAALGVGLIVVQLRPSAGPPAALAPPPSLPAIEAPLGQTPLGQTPLGQTPLGQTANPPSVPEAAAVPAPPLAGSHPPPRPATRHDAPRRQAAARAPSWEAEEARQPTGSQP